MRVAAAWRTAPPQKLTSIDKSNVLETRACGVRSSSGS